MEGVYCTRSLVCPSSRVDVLDVAFPTPFGAEVGIQQAKFTDCLAELHDRSSLRVLMEDFAQLCVASRDSIAKGRMGCHIANG